MAAISAATKARVDEDFVYVTGEITRDPPNDGLRGHPYRADGIRRVLGDEHAVHVEFRQTGPEDARGVMPRAVVVCEWASGRGERVWGDGLIKEDCESSVVLYPELPRDAASLNPGIIRRRIRRPPEPRGDRKVRGGYGNRESCNPFSRVKVPRPADFPDDVRRAREGPVISV